jgi:hypothetical protein
LEGRIDPNLGTGARCPSSNDPATERIAVLIQQLGQELGIKSRWLWNRLWNVEPNSPVNRLTQAAGGSEYLVLGTPMGYGVTINRHR